jgi:hypothetical protein
MIEKDYSRFDKKVAKGPGCWEWTGCLNDDGYGRFNIDGTIFRSHRLSYERWIGEIQTGMYVMHLCNNPGCVSPFHLEVGTQLDNMRYASVSGRMRTGENNPRAKLTGGDVLEIRSRWAAGEKQKTLCSDYGVTSATITQITKRNSWKHVI